MKTWASCTSRDGRRIALSERRWAHIVESHNYMAGSQQLVLNAVADPDYVVKGRDREKLAVKFSPATTMGPKYAVVVYVEEDEAGFSNGFHDFGS